LIEEFIMRHIQRKILTILVFFFLSLGSQAAADEFTCWLCAPAQNDIWVIAYWADRDGDRGDPIWKGKIPAGGKVQIKSDTGHIRYDYAREENQPLQGDVSRRCVENKEILID
jgi:hypothetical protein